MKKKDNNLEKNISRLVKLTAESDRPSEAFMEDLISEATKELARQQRTGAGRLGMSRTVRWAGVAAAAVILIAAGLFFIHDRPTKQAQDYARVGVAKSPIEMIKAKSLNLAYRRGGMEAVERQYDEAFKNAGPRPAKLTIEDVLAEFNGS